MASKASKAGGETRVSAVTAVLAKSRSVDSVCSEQEGESESAAALALGFTVDELNTANNDNSFY